MTSKNGLMNYSARCGYYGHFCNHGVQFISRGGAGVMTSDYCVAGERVRVYDDGRDAVSSSVSPAKRREQLRAILMYELQQYADYVRWHVEHNIEDAKYSYRAELQAFEWAERINPSVLMERAA